MTRQATTEAYGLSDALWTEAAPQAREADLAERRATTRCAAALGGLVVLAAAVHLSGLLGGRLGSANSSGGDADARTRTGHWEANVVNNGWFDLELVSSRGDLPGVDVRDVRLDPARLPAGTHGVLRLDFTVTNCDVALHALGRSGVDASDVTAGTQATVARLSVTTRGPLGTTARTSPKSFPDLIGDLVASACGQTDEADPSS